MSKQQVTSWLNIGIKNIVFIITIIAILFFGGVLVFYPQKATDMTTIRLTIFFTFFVSFIFTWILAGYESEKRFEEIQKIPAIRSYRQTKTIGENAKYLINMIDDMIKISEQKEDLEAIERFKRIKDAVHIIVVHVNNIKMDWGDVVKDISEVNKIEGEIDNIEERIKEIDNYQSVNPDDKKEETQKLMQQKQYLQTQVDSLLEYIRKGKYMREEVLRLDRETYLRQDRQPYKLDISISNLVYYSALIQTDDDFESNKLEDKIRKKLYGQPLGFNNVNIILSDKPNVYVMTFNAGGMCRSSKEYVIDTILDSDEKIKLVTISQFAWPK